MDYDYEITYQYNDWVDLILEQKRADILEAGISIGIISSMKVKKSKTKMILGECKKVTDLEKLYCPHDFFIIIYEKNCEGLSDEQMKILLWHEINHIGIDEKGKFFVKPHDIEEFEDIINAHGLHWNAKAGE